MSKSRNPQPILEDPDLVERLKRGDDRVARIDAIAGAGDQQIGRAVAAPLVLDLKAAAPPPESICGRMETPVFKAATAKGSLCLGYIPPGGI